MNIASKIYVAGHQGLVGSALVKILHHSGYQNILVRTLQELDLRNQLAVATFFETEKPEYVFLAAARVGGIKANMQFPAQFIYDNLMIQSNVIHAAYSCGVKKLLFLGSSCIYPRICEQPIQESSLMTGPLEKTNEFYALAKLAGLKMCQAYRRQYGADFISCMPTNLYGPHDNFDHEKSHVIPALISKFFQAKQLDLAAVALWGTGSARREFLFVDDCAQALILLMQHYSDEDTINIGTGMDLTICELAHLIKEFIGYEGEVLFEGIIPDGTPYKLLDVQKIANLGWKAGTALDIGLKKTVQWYQEYHEK